MCGIEADPHRDGVALYWLTHVQGQRRRSLAVLTMTDSVIGVFCDVTGNSLVGMYSVDLLVTRCSI